MGTLEPGKVADLVVVDADPLEDVGVLNQVAHRALVMKGGVPVGGTVLGDRPNG